MSDLWLPKCSHPHARLSAYELGKIRFKNPLVCCIRGLPIHLDAAALRSNEWYGRFEGIDNIIITTDKHNNVDYYTNNEIARNIAWITFKNEQQVHEAIKYTNNCLSQFGQFGADKINANFAWNGYCKKFINKQECEWSQCPHKHSWGDIQSVITNNMKKSPFETLREENIYLKQRMEMIRNQLSFEQKKNKEHEKLIKTMREREEELVGAAGNGKNDDMVQKLLEQQKKTEKQNELLRKDIIDINLKRAKIAQEFDQIIKKIVFYQDIDQRQKAEIVRLKNEVEKIRREYIESQKVDDKEAEKGLDDQKELELAFDKLAIVGMVDDEEKKKEMDYKKWTKKDIIDWIINLDNIRFSKYFKDLKRNMDIENCDINGECLRNWTKNDLERFGIHQFNDKQIIFNHIQNLINNHK